MKKKLDSENLGIILLNAFMDEFFPKEESSIPDMFQLIHYNGLARSNVNKEVGIYRLVYYCYSNSYFLLGAVSFWLSDFTRI